MNTPLIFKAPISGSYMISCNMARAIPTGRMETIPNPKRKWWQLWKPKTITRPEYRMEKFTNGAVAVQLKEGDEVVPVLETWRVNNDRDNYY